MVAHKMGRAFVGTVAAVAAGLLALAPAGHHVTASAQTELKVVLEKVDLSTADPTEKQKKVLDRIKKSPGTVDLQVVRLKATAGAMADAPVELDLALPGNGKFTATARTASTYAPSDGGNRLVWKGDKASEAIQLRVAPKTVTGLIYTADKVYAVEPLGGGLQAVVQLDQSKYDDDKKHGAKHTEPKTGKIVEKKDPLPKDGAMPVEVAVLVAYTPRVDGLQADVNDLITAAIDLSNLSYENSKINLRLKLVGTVKVNYAESGSHQTDLDLFRGTDDQKMDEIHALRTEKKADVCVLLVDNDEFCGLAAAIGATDSTAFAVVHHDCAVKNLSFPHEIGHLQGARHNLEVDPTIETGRKYNHGYLSTKADAKWRTIMAYPAEGKPNRIPFWSNPDVTHEGEDMGVANKQDNARVLRETALDIGAFR